MTNMELALAPEQMKLFNKFKKCVNARSIEKMDKQLYQFFMNHCGFIAHYNIHGFRAEYADIGFLNWFKEFSQPNWMFFLPHGDEYQNLKQACVAYAQQAETSVLEHFDRESRNRKMKMLQSLSKELGVKITEQGKERTTKAEALFLEEEDGQLALFA